MPHQRQRCASILKSDYTKVALFAAFLLWQLPCTGWTRSLLRLFTGKMCVQLSIFLLIHLVRFSLRHFSRRFLHDHWELLPNFDSPHHNLRQSFQPWLARIPKCSQKDEDRQQQEADEVRKPRKIPLFTFIRASRKKSRHA